MDLNETPSQFVTPIDDASGVGAARRCGREMAESLGFDDTAVGRLAIVVTELSNNLVRHAGRGELILRVLREGGAVGIEALALDRGPGISDTALAMRDGYTTGSTPGTGLGAIARLATRVDMYSQPGAGTAMMAQLWRTIPASESFEVGAVCLPYPGETARGDAWAVDGQPDRLAAVVVDGLGHGVLASEASRAAIEEFYAGRDASAEEVVRRMHRRLHRTRGAAVAVAVLAPASRMLDFAGVGNISGCIIGERESHSMVSFNGIVGHEIYKLRSFLSPWPKNALLIMHSDGLINHWTLRPYPGLIAHHPSLVAGVLYRDFVRGRDDVTVVVVRLVESGP